MKPERALAVDRPLARHCPALLRSGPTPADLLAQFARVGDKIARLLGDSFASMAGYAPVMRCLSAQKGDADSLAGMIAPLAGNCLLTAGSSPLLVSFQAEGVLRLLDRSFGGPGDVPLPLPDAFPYSAELMLHRLEATAAAVLTTALDREITPKARASRLGDLPSLAKDSQLAVLQIEVVQHDDTCWIVTIVATLPTLEALFDQRERQPPSGARPHSATEEPFCDLPLTLRAVLIDMRMAVSALSELRAGQILPVSVARSVPLCVGEAAIAHGTIGALDDRVAVQITHAF